MATAEEIHAKYGTDPNWRTSQSGQPVEIPTAPAVPAVAIPAAPSAADSTAATPAELSEYDQRAVDHNARISGIHETYGTNPDWRSAIRKPEEERDYDTGIGYAFMRGLERMRAMPDVAQGDFNELADHYGNMEKWRMSDEDIAIFEDMREQDGWWAKAGQLMMNPRLVLQVVAESLPMMAAPIAGALAGGLAAGAMTANPIGVAAGAMAGGGIGSFFTEYYNALGEFFSQNGVDMTNAQQLKTAFGDAELMAEARAFAKARGIPIAIFDALSMGLAGKVAAPARKLQKAVTGTQLFGGTTAEIVTQAGFGAAGEAGAQLASVGHIEDELDVLLEGVAEIVPGLVEATVMGYVQRKAAAREAGLGDPNESPLAALDQPDEGGQGIPPTDIDPATGKVVSIHGEYTADELDIAFEQSIIDLEREGAYQQREESLRGRLSSAAEVEAEMIEGRKRVIAQINASRAQAGVPALTEEEINDPAIREKLDLLAEQYMSPAFREGKDAAAKQKRGEIERMYADETERVIAEETQAALESEMITPRGQPIEGEPVDVAGAQPIDEGMLIRDDVLVPPGGRPLNTQLGEALRAAGVAPPDDTQPPGPPGAITPTVGPAVGPDARPGEAAAGAQLEAAEQDRQLIQDDLDERAAIREADVPAAPEPTDDIPGFGPQPAVEWADERLAQQEAHDGLDRLASEVIRGGGVTLVESKEIGVSYDHRTPSQNPPWAQAIIANEGASHDIIVNAVEKAKAGKRLGARQKRIIAAMLDEWEAPSLFDSPEEADAATPEEIVAARERRDALPEVGTDMAPDIPDDMPPAFSEESIAEGGLPEQVIYKSERIKVTGISRIGGDMVVSGTKPDGTEIRFPLAYARPAMIPSDDFALEQQPTRTPDAPVVERPREEVDADLGIVGDMFSVEANKQVDLVEESRRLAKEDVGIPAGLELREQTNAELAALAAETKAEIEAFAEKGETGGGLDQTSILAGIQKLRLHRHHRAGTLMESATAAFNKHGLTASPLDVKTMPSKKLRIKVGNKNVDVLQNPTNKQRRVFNQSIRMEFEERGLDTGLDPLTRATWDMDGNTWIWASFDGMHVVIEGSLEAQHGIQNLSQQQPDLPGVEVAGLDEAAQTLQERFYNAEALHEKWRKQIDQSDPDPAEVAEVERVINDMAATGDPDAFLLAVEHDWWLNWGETEITKSEQGPGRKPIPIRIKSNHERYKQSRKANKWGSVGGLEKVSSQGVSANISQLSWTVPYTTLTFETGKDQQRLERLIEVYNQTHESQVAGSPPAPAAAPAGFVINEEKFLEEGPDTEQRVFAATVPKKRTALDIRLKNAGEPFMSQEEAEAIVTRWEQHAINQGKESRKVSHSGPEAHKDNFNRVIISLFDTTGTWANPYALAGYDVRTLDIKDGIDVTDFSVAFMDEMFNNFEGKEIYGILAACPCTTFSNSSTRWRKDRHENSDPVESRKWIKEIWGVEAAEAVDENGNWLYASAHDYGIALVHKTMQTLEYLRPKFWALENPEGRIEKSAGLPDKWRTGFQPNNFGDPYTKRTLLWGNFNDDMPTANVDPVQGSKMHLMSPSADRSSARAETPVGFSYGFFMANNYLDMSPLERTKADYWYVAGAIEEAFRAGVTETEIRKNITLDESYEPDGIDETREAIRDLIMNPPGTPPTDTTPDDTGGGPGLAGGGGLGRSTIEQIRSKSATALSRMDKVDLQAFAIRLDVAEKGTKMEIAKRLKEAVTQHPLERREVPREAPIVSPVAEAPETTMTPNEARAELRKESLARAGFASEENLRNVEAKAAELNELVASIKEKYDLSSLEADIDNMSEGIFVYDIAVPVGMRNQQRGTKAMRELMDFADRYGEIIQLEPTQDPETQEAVMNFYEKLGFVEDEGLAGRLTRLPAAPEAAPTLAERWTAKEVSDTQDSIGDPLNPKVAPLVSALNKANIVTRMSGDLYGDNLVYVDLNTPIDPTVMLPVGWIATSQDVSITRSDVEGGPVIHANGEPMSEAAIEARRETGKRIARAGSEPVSKSDIAALVKALKYTALAPTEAEIAAAEADTDTDATDAMKKAGNYKKGRMVLPGDIKFSIESPRGETRHGNLKLRDTYGEFPEAMGADGDPMDAFVNAKIREDWDGDVYVVDQIFPEVGGFDEHKVMFGYNNMIDARRAYRRNYNKDWKGAGAVTKMSLAEFKTWLAEPGPHKTPAALSDVTEAGRKERLAHGKKVKYSLSKDTFNAPSDAWTDAVLGGGAKKMGDMPDTGPMNYAVSELLKAEKFRLRQAVNPAANQVGPVIPASEAETVATDQIVALSDLQDDGRIGKIVADLNKEFPRANIKLVNRSDPQIRAELEDKIQMDMGERIQDLTVPGLYDPNTNNIYIFKDRLMGGMYAAMGLTVKKIALHEMVHRGLHVMFQHHIEGSKGEKAYIALMEDIYDRVPARHKPLLKKLELEYGLDVNEYVDDKWLAAEELVANLAENQPGHALVARVVEFVRKFLERIGIIGPADTWSDQDIRDLIAEAHGSLKLNPEVQTRMSLRDATIVEEVTLDETGEVFEVETSANDAISDVNKRIAICKKLRACV